MGSTRGCTWHGRVRIRTALTRSGKKAYATMDPIAQNGWEHRRGHVAEVGADLVRDVFVAADAMHDAAMSEMDGNTPMEEGSEAAGAGAGEDSPPMCGGHRVDTLDCMEDELQGESP